MSPDDDTKVMGVETRHSVANYHLGIAATCRPFFRPENVFYAIAADTEMQWSLRILAERVARVSAAEAKQKCMNSDTGHGPTSPAGRFANRGTLASNFLEIASRVLERYLLPGDGCDQPRPYDRTRREAAPRHRLSVTEAWCPKPASAATHPAEARAPGCSHASRTAAPRPAIRSSTAAGGPRHIAALERARVSDVVRSRESRVCRALARVMSALFADPRSTRGARGSSSRRGNRHGMQRVRQRLHRAGRSTHAVAPHAART